MTPLPLSMVFLPPVAVTTMETKRTVQRLEAAFLSTPAPLRSSPSGCSTSSNGVYSYCQSCVSYLLLRTSTAWREYNAVEVKQFAPSRAFEQANKERPGVESQTMYRWK